MLKVSELLNHKKPGRDFQCLLRSELSKSEKDFCFQLNDILEKKKKKKQNTETNNRSVVSRGSRKEGREMEKEK